MGHDYGRADRTQEGVCSGSHLCARGSYRRTVLRDGGRSKSWGPKNHSSCSFQANSQAKESNTCTAHAAKTQCCKQALPSMTSSGGSRNLDGLRSISNKLWPSVSNRDPPAAGPAGGAPASMSPPHAPPPLFSRDILKGRVKLMRAAAAEAKALSTSRTSVRAGAGCRGGALLDICEGATDVLVLSMPTEDMPLCKPLETDARLLDASPPLPLSCIPGARGVGFTWSLGLPKASSFKSRYSWHTLRLLSPLLHANSIILSFGLSYIVA